MKTEYDFDTIREWISKSSVWFYCMVYNILIDYTCTYVFTVIYIESMGDENFSTDDKKIRIQHY